MTADGRIPPKRDAGPESAEQRFADVCSPRFDCSQRVESAAERTLWRHALAPVDAERRSAVAKGSFATPSGRSAPPIEVLTEPYGTRAGRPSTSRSQASGRRRSVHVAPGHEETLALALHTSRSKSGGHSSRVPGSRIPDQGVIPQAHAGACAGGSDEPWQLGACAATVCAAQEHASESVVVVVSTIVAVTPAVTRIQDIE